MLGLRAAPGDMHRHFPARGDGMELALLSRVMGMHENRHASDRGIGERELAAHHRGRDQHLPRWTYAWVFVLGAAVVAGLMTWWAVMHTIDRDTALAELHQAARLAALAAGLVTLAFAGLLIGLWRQQQQAALLREHIRQD